MFTGAEVLLIQAGLNAAGTVLGMGSAYTADKINAINADAEAKIARSEADQQAIAIRRQGEGAKGAARAALAASGVSLAGGGTVDQIEQQITRDTEHDAYAALLTGDRTVRALQQSASEYRRGAKDSVTAGALQIGDTVLGTGAKLGNWKRSQK
jgi:hypothetical protein